MEELYLETPETVSSIDSERSMMKIEFTILDVEKENISLMISENGCYLSAPAENTVYVATMSFPCPVVPAQAKAIYEESYLKVDIPLRDDLKNFIKVPVE